MTWPSTAAARQLVPTLPATVERRQLPPPPDPLSQAAAATRILSTVDQPALPRGRLTPLLCPIEQGELAGSAAVGCRGTSGSDRDSNRMNMPSCSIASTAALTPPLRCCRRTIMTAATVFFCSKAAVVKVIPAVGRMVSWINPHWADHHRHQHCLLLLFPKAAAVRIAAVTATAPLGSVACWDNMLTAGYNENQQREKKRNRRLLLILK